MDVKSNRYAGRGVSSSKEDVHAAIKNLDKGLFPKAFCKIVPDYLTGDEDYCLVMHADGAGTKSSLAYLYWKETGDMSVWRGIAQDAIVMNTDDMACVGVVNDIYISNHIARNSNRVDDEALAKVIQGYSNFFQKMGDLGVNLYNAGGETADVGSYTTTMGIDVTATAVISKDKVIDCSNIGPGEYIVGLASYGKSTYEDKENSGIRSNGLTLAINSLLSPYYRKYEETMDGTIDKEKLN